MKKIKEIVTAERCIAAVAVLVVFVLVFALWQDLDRREERQQARQCITDGYTVYLDGTPQQVPEYMMSSYDVKSVDTENQRVHLTTREQKDEKPSLLQILFK